MYLARMIGLLSMSGLVAMHTVAAQPPGPVPPPRIGMPIVKQPAKRPRPLAGTGDPSATLRGEIYVVTPSGRTLRGAAVKVSLLVDEPALRDSVAPICRDYERTAAALGAEIAANSPDAQTAAGGIRDFQEKRARFGRQEELRGEAAANGLRFFWRIIPLIKMHQADEASADANGQYRFEGLRGGRYLIFADWSIDGVSHRWWKPVTLVGGQTSIQDLDRQSEGGPHTFCSAM